MEMDDYFAIGGGIDPIHMAAYAISYLGDSIKKHSQLMNEDGDGDGEGQREEMTKIELRAR